MSMAIENPTSPKTSAGAAWDDAAAGWDRHAAKIRDWLQSATVAMQEMADIRAGQHVLDVAAGAGDQTLDIARRVGPSGGVVASDISEGILGLAERNAVRAGVDNVRFHQADAQTLGLEQGCFDAAVCRLGLMFLPDPLAGLVAIRRVLKPGARLCSIVFAGPEANPCLRILISTALRHAGLAPRDPFVPGGLLSLGRQGDLDGRFRQAGFANVATTRLDAPFRLPRTADYLEFVQDAAAPIVQLLAPLTAAARAAAWADIETQLDAYQTESGWVGPNALLVTVGQNPAAPRDGARPFLSGNQS